MYKVGARQYKQTRVATADPGMILLMLYDGAIRFCNTARERIIARDYEGKGNAIGKAQAIVFELMCNLDHKTSPALCVSLESLYLFVGEQLTDANMNMKVESLDAAVGVLTTLRDAWAKVVTPSSAATTPTTDTP